MVLITALVVASGLASADARAAVDPASNVTLQVVARPGSASGAGQDFELRDGGVLRSGDGVQLRLESDADAYVYVVAYGSSHSAVLLHPFSARADDALIQRGRMEVIPGGGVFLPLDGQEGRETLFTIVSAAPLTDITDLLPRIEAHGDDLTAITAMIDATYPGARRLTFKHIGARPLVGVAASASRVESSAPTQDAGAEPRAGDAQPERVVGASLLPPADGGWSVPSTQGFGTSEAAGAGTGSVVDPTVSTLVLPAAGASAAEDEAASAPASSALRKAREAAGIEEHAFQGILATLPDAGQAAVPEAVGKPYKEQGVLSAEGSRIRSLGSAPLGSDEKNRSQN